MNTFFRKLMRSFPAMFCGWVACNLTWWVGAILTSQGENIFRLREGVFLGGCMGAVILAAWLLVFLPVDLLVRDASTLRAPPLAALCGFLSAFAIVFVVFGWAAWFEVAAHGFFQGLWRTLDKAALPYALGTCATGTVAAYVRARMDHPKPLSAP